MITNFQLEINLAAKVFSFFYVNVDVLTYKFFAGWLLFNSSVANLNSKNQRLFSNLSSDSMLKCIEQKQVYLVLIFFLDQVTYYFCLVKTWCYVRTETHS